MNIHHFSIYNYLLFYFLLLFQIVLFLHWIKCAFTNVDLYNFAPPSVGGFDVFIMSGIINASQNCYFNALIQCLANNERWLRILWDHRDRHTFPSGKYLINYHVFS